ncbi:LamG domain-containing protein [candidate division WWE3 bacterium]|uniref:LamG domain-containing protein n=1 Tax=candidate division WWE3 bacterium TaxID=2053526 RepID=A0A7X9DL98_UNCKA|nr:LamG domain-containing protein [candidate division WWE3 bacterium]
MSSNKKNTSKLKILFPYGVSAVVIITTIVIVFTQFLKINLFAPAVKGSAPIAEWHFNEGVGTTVYDSSSNQNDLTLTNATWFAEGSAESPQSYSVLLSGSTSYASRINDSDFDFGSGSFTIGGWFRHPSNTDTLSSTNNILARYNTAGFKIYMNTSGYMCFDIDSDNTFGGAEYDTACSSAVQGSYADSKWHNFTAVRNGSTSIVLYVDGVQVGQDTDLVAGSLDTTATLYVGVGSDGISNHWRGFIGQMFVYNYANDLDQIRANYMNPQVAIQQGASPKSFSTDGLVGYWNMDDPGVDTQGETVSDSSGNNKDLTLWGDDDKGFNGSGMDCTVAGKFGTGCDFDGIDDFLNYASTWNLLNGTTAFTVSAWVKPDFTETTADDFVIVQTIDSTNFYLGFSNTADDFQGDIVTNNGSVSSYTSDLSWTADTWHNIIFTYNGSEQIIYWDGKEESRTTQTGFLVNSTWLLVGTDNNTTFDGTIDEVRIYNRSLPPTEISQLYNWTPGPVAHWKLDENSGTNVYDSSGNGNNSTAWSGNTAWTTGKFGSALSFDGQDDVVSFAETTTTDFGSVNDSYTVEAWFKTTANYSANGMIVAKNDDGSTYPFMLYVGTDEKVYFRIYGGSDGTANSLTTLNDGQWHHAVGIRDIASDKVFLYVDGVLNGEGTDNTTIAVTNDSAIALGNYPSVLSRDFNGQIDDVRIYNYARTPNQITQDMNAGHPVPGSPVGSALGHWKFDEGYGDTANNSGNAGSDINGNLASSATACPAAGACPTWSNTAKYGKALSFDGSDDYVDLGTSLDDNDEITVSAWVNADTLSSGGAGIVGNYTNTCSSGDYVMYLDSSTGKFTVNWSNRDVIVSEQTISTGNWYHLAFTRSGFVDNWTIKTYINGNIDNTATTIYNTDGTNVTTAIGRWGACSAWGFFDGFIDDVRVYNSALTDDQIKLIFNQGEATIMGTLGNNASYEKQSAAQEFCIPGDTASCAPPMALWNLDEGTGQYVYDASGNNYNGVLGLTWDTEVNDDPVWVTGKYGSGLKFTSEQVTLSNFSVASLPANTISFWMNRTFTDDIGKDSFVFLFRNGSNEGVAFYYYNSTDVWRARVVLNGQLNIIEASPAAIPQNTWTYVTLAWDSGTADNFKLYINGIQQGNTVTGINDWAGASVNSARFGTYSTNFYQGLLDHFVIYNYARTPAQISWDMNRGAPVARYKFDECTGTTANNSAATASGADAGYDATISIGGTDDYTAPGTCNGSATDSWKAGATGKFESSIAFDGADDYAYLSSDLSVQGWTALTVSTWIYPISGGGGIDHVIIGKSDANNGGYGNTSFRIMYNYANQLMFRVQPEGDFNTHEITNNTALSMNSRWYHVVGTWNGTTMNLYLDGVLVGTDTTAGSGYLNNCQILYMGRHSANNTDQFYNGLLDDVRIYNYALTTSQINSLYNGGSAVYFN